MNPVSAAVPPTVVMLKLPVDPVPTTATRIVEDSTLNDATTVPPSDTELAPVRLVPVIVMVDPLLAEVGVNKLMVGVLPAIYVNPVSAAVPPAAVMLKLPVDPVPTTAISVVEDSTLNDATAVPPSATELAPVRLVPVTVMVAPLAAEVGVKELIVGVPVI